MPVSRGGAGSHSPESRQRKADRIACDRIGHGTRCEHAGCRRCELGYHCGDHAAGCHQACGPTRACDHPLAFQVFRRDPPGSYAEAGLSVPPDRPQFEGVVFTDGTCVIRWLSRSRSTAVFGSFGEMMAVHGHPEYGTAIRWLDGPGEGGEP